MTVFSLVCSSFIAARLFRFVGAGGEVKDFHHWRTDWDIIAELLSLIWIGGVAPDSFNILTWVPAIVVISHEAHAMLMRLLS